MAKEAPPPPPAEGDAPKKSKLKLILIVVAGLVLVLGIAVAALLMLTGPSGHDEEADEPAKKTKTADKPKGPPAYLKLDPFTVNVLGEYGDQFMQLHVTAEFGEAMDAEASKAFMPSIRNKVLLLLSSKKVAELTPREGKENLAREIKDAMNTVLGTPGKDGKAPEGPVRDILFTDMIIQ